MQRSLQPSPESKDPNQETITADRWHYHGGGPCPVYPYTEVIFTQFMGKGIRHVAMAHELDWKQVTGWAYGTRKARTQNYMNEVMGWHPNNDPTRFNSDSTEVVDTILRDGSTAVNAAANLDWVAHDAPRDIVAWRIMPHRSSANWTKEDTDYFARQRKPLPKT